MPSLSKFLAFQPRSLLASATASRWAPGHLTPVARFGIRTGTAFLDRASTSPGHEIEFDGSVALLLREVHDGVDVLPVGHYPLGAHAEELLRHPPKVPGVVAQADGLGNDPLRSRVGGVEDHAG